VLIRSLDSDTASMMLGQLSPEEAAALRAAMRELGPVDPEEQADIAAEFRRTRPVAGQTASGVELSLSATVHESVHDERRKSTEAAPATGRHFEFIANASTSALVTFLCREHPQTIALVLAHLTPERAAAVLAALPEKLQADAIERLAALGEADPESVVVLERELAAWLAARGENRGVLAHRRETAANILAAADAKTRRGILSKLRVHNTTLASQLAGDHDPSGPPESGLPSSGNDARWSRSSRVDTAGRRLGESRQYASKQATDTSARIQRGLAALKHSVAAGEAQASSTPPLPRIEFDQLIHLDSAGLSALLRVVDANVLAVALVGSHEEFVDRVCRQMPKRTARAFRRELRRVGPTRLSDMEMAQRIVADTAARQLAQRCQTIASAC
jgi:flagellar motor switch protein FliG